jgi:hypothetical protein
MKGLFPQYDDPSNQDYGSVWQNALFIFDTNVLLNLYRYQAGTRDELLNILSQLSDRIWVPHHVALEFQRNRLKVIAEQNKRFFEVRRAIDKTRSTLAGELEKLQLQTRHSLIDPQKLTSGFEELTDKFLTELTELEGSQQKLSAPDPLKQKIEALFDGRVGSPPTNQTEIDKLYTEADMRFKFKIPPGYQDSEKDKDEPDEHINGGIVYKRKYGDFLVWNQLLEHSKSVNAKSVIFVTDDGKDDWWQKIESEGPKTVGPRPELIEEALMKASVETLLMYKPEGFLKYAKEFLEAKVSEETLKEVRELSAIRSVSEFDIREFHEKVIRAEKAVLLWLEGRFDKVQANRFDYPDFIAEQAGKYFGFEVKVAHHSRISSVVLRQSLYRGYYALKENGFSEFSFVWIVNSSSEVEELQQRLVRLTRDEMPVNLRMIIGVLDDSASGGVGFLPYCDFACN